MVTNDGLVDAEGRGSWVPLELSYEAASGRWVGSRTFATTTATTRMTYVVQAVDKRGNVTWLEYQPASMPASGVAPGLAAVYDVAVGEVPPPQQTPSLSISDVSVKEGNSGTTTAVFTVSLSAASAQVVTVGYATADGTATTADGDYVATSGTLTFPAGTTTQTVSVTVNGDAALRAERDVQRGPGSPTNATVADGTGVGTIVNDDAAGMLSVSDVSVSEGNSVPATATFTVTLSSPMSQTVTVGYATMDGSESIADGTARTADGDYVATSGTLTFAPGTTMQTVAVTVNGDTRYEPNETFSLVLSGARTRRSPSGRRRHDHERRRGDCGDRDPLEHDGDGRGCGRRR